MNPRHILLTGATGFVGGHLYEALIQAGHAVRCASRRPERAALRMPGRDWVELDLHRPELLGAALEGIDVVYYLVHSMAEGPGYLRRELDAAFELSRAAERAGVERIVYLGGVAPAGVPSEHLESRIATGCVLRGGKVPCIELRAGMIIGAGSESWRICRDLAARLPFMILPKWSNTRSQPVAVADVVAALLASATTEFSKSAVYDIPGPEIMTAKDILLRIAKLRGMRPRTMHVPVLTPKLSSYWLKLVSGADYTIARELVVGLSSDLVAAEAIFWDRLPHHTLMSFDDAARRALAEEPNVNPFVGALERVARFASAME